MPDIKFDKVWDELKGGVTALAASSIKAYASKAIKDAESMLEELKEDMESWTIELAKGEMTVKEFEYLVNSKKDSFKVEALKQTGLGAIEINKFKTGVLDLITDTVTKLI